MRSLDPVQTAIQHFESTAKCRLGCRPQIEFDGVWTVLCARPGDKRCCCRITDPENLTPTNLIIQWTQAFALR